MDAPTPRSADNGTPGGEGWFTPRKQPDPTADGTPPGPSGTEGRRLAALRPVGRSTAPGPAGAPPRATPQERIPARPGQAPVAAAPTAPAPPAAGSPGANPAPTPAAAPSAGVTAAAGTRSPDARTEPGRTLVTETQAAPEPRTVPAAPTPPGEPARPAPSAQSAPPRRTAPPKVHVPAQRAASPGDQSPGESSTAFRSASPDAVLIRRTMAEVGPVADKVTSYFYALLFVRHPDLRSLFPPAMDAQRDRLLKALLTAAEHIDNTPVLVDYLQNLGRGHRKYGTRAEHYPAVGECLIGALSKYADAVWDVETEAAWIRAYTTISQVMIDAAAADELRAPAWWYAEVVAHEARTADIAVLTLRPDQPYPFLAGQYAGLETPWWPRIWRHYSFASAPRSDGLLTLHVKAVPAGWVSNALVHRAQLGDIVRLGPPAGSMTVDHTRDSGLLCLGGGTGIAPLKALVEDVAEHGSRRPVEVFYGARSDHDLYDIDTLLRLKQAHPWLEVRPVIDRHDQRQLPDAIRTFGPWTGYDAYVSGPPGMIRSGVDALRGAGIPLEHIRHDSVEELVASGS
ncbi:globin domain-containing protein [Streptomyces sp. NPDC086091]|uniref:globin domain-containing protein n=1 Tax=Streptomyces sp. NPDC086091 TaxID=3365751 RepID=UPI00381DDE8F